MSYHHCCYNVPDVATIIVAQSKMMNALFALDISRGANPTSLERKPGLGKAYQVLGLEGNPDAALENRKETSDVMIPAIGFPFLQ
jgi:hypothetical protein